MHSGFVVSKQ